MTTISDRSIAADREHFLTEGCPPRPARVRHPILASWQRSREHHVDADRVEPPYDGELDLESPLCRAAAPALAGLREAVEGQSLSIVLADHEGLVLGRLTADDRLERRLDRAMLAPGFRYAEGTVGTNGIGTALEVGGPATVLGHEHWAEHLEDLACAAVPVTHPVTGRVVGLVNLTTWRRDAGPLLVPLARTTAQQVQATLLDHADARERALFREYLRLERRTGGVVVAVGHDVTMLSDRARAQLDDAERAAVVEAVERAWHDGRSGVVAVRLADGRGVRLRCRLVVTGGDSAGVVATLSRHAVTAPTTPGRAPGRAPGQASPTLADLERAAIVRALRHHDGDRAAAARELGLSRATIYRRIRAYRIVDAGSAPTGSSTPDGGASRITVPRSGNVGAMSAHSASPTPAPTPPRSRGALIGSGVRWLSTWGWRSLVIAVVALALGWVVEHTWSILLPLILALALTTVLQPPARFLESRLRLPSGLAAGLVILLGLALIGGIGALLAPTLGDDVATLAGQASKGLSRVEDWLLGTGLGITDEQVESVITAAQDRLRDSATTIASGVIVGVSAVGNGLINLVLTLVLAFFFLKDGRRFLPWLRRWSGSSAGSHLAEVAERSYSTLATFVRTQALVGLIDAVFIGAGLLLVGVPLALHLAVLTFLAAFAPIVGAVTVGVLAVLVALVSNGWGAALIVAAIVLAVQQLEGNVLLPWLQGRSLDLHAGVVLLAIVLGSTLFGVVGAFLSVPAIAVLVVVARYLDEQVREDQVEPDPEPDPDPGPDAGADSGPDAGADPEPGAAATDRPADTRS